MRCMRKSDCFTAKWVWMFRKREWVEEQDLDWGRHLEEGIRVRKPEQVCLSDHKSILGHQCGIEVVFASPG